MSLLTIIAEYWRFLKANLWRLLLGAVLGALILLGARYLLGQVWLSNRNEAYQYLNRVYQQEPAEFQAIISIEDGQLFTSSNIYDEYFSSEPVIKEIEDRTGIQFHQWLDSERQLELFKSDGFRGGIAAIRDNSSGLITFRFLVGKTSAENLKIAQAYAELLSEERFDFNQKHQINITNPAQTVELLDLDMVETVPTPATLNMFAGMTAKNIIIFSVLGLIMGAIITALILWLARLRKPQIAYAFEYSWDLDDKHLLWSGHKGQVGSELAQVIQIPHVDTRLVVSQAGHEGIDLTDLTKQAGCYYLADLGQSGQIQETIQEIVILIHSNVTDKAWYRDQYKLAKLFHVPLKIIQVI